MDPLGISNVALFLAGLALRSARTNNKEFMRTQVRSRFDKDDKIVKRHRRSNRMFLIIFDILFLVGMVIGGIDIIANVNMLTLEHIILLSSLAAAFIILFAAMRFIKMRDLQEVIYFLAFGIPVNRNAIWHYIFIACLMAPTLIGFFV